MVLSRGVVGCLERLWGGFPVLCDSGAVIGQTSLTGQPLVRVRPWELARSCDLLSAVNLCGFQGAVSREKIAVLFSPSILQHFDPKAGDQIGKNYEELMQTILNFILNNGHC